MRVGVFYPPVNKEHTKVLRAFVQGVTGEDHADFESLYDYDCNTDKYDVCVVFGIAKRAVPYSKHRGKIIDCERQAGKDIVIIEKGYIKRNEYYSVGLNGLNGNAVFNNANVTADRFKLLHTSIAPWRTNDSGFVLLIGQVPWDASVQHTDHIDWLLQTTKVIKEYTDRPIVFRPHPLWIRDEGKFGFEKFPIPTIPGVQTSAGNLEYDLAHAHAVVTFNSNTGVDAALAGVPVFCADAGSMIYLQASKGLENIEDPPLWNRSAWASQLAYTQWTRAEMEQGLPWRNIKELILKRIEDAAA